MQLRRMAIYGLGALLACEFVATVEAKKEADAAYEAATKAATKTKKTKKSKKEKKAKKPVVPKIVTDDGDDKKDDKDKLTPEQQAVKDADLKCSAVSWVVKVFRQAASGIKKSDSDEVKIAKTKAAIAKALDKSNSEYPDQMSVHSPEEKDPSKGKQNTGKYAYRDFMQLLMGGGFSSLKLENVGKAKDDMIETAATFFEEYEQDIIDLVLKEKGRVGGINFERILCVDMSGACTDEDIPLTDEEQEEREARAEL